METIIKTWVGIGELYHNKAIETVAMTFRTVNWETSYSTYKNYNYDRVGTDK